MADHHDLEPRGGGSDQEETVPSPFGWLPREADAPEADPVPPAFWPEPERQHAAPGRMRGFALFLAALLGAGVGSGATLVVADRVLEDRTTTSSGAVVRVAPPIEPAEGRPADIVAKVAEAVLPSIVRIDVAQALGRGGTGSGVIYRPDGYIVTSGHVVEGSDAVQVRLPNGERLDASVVGTAAPAVDIAVVKVARERLPAATFGSSVGMRPGDLAVAIGSPFGLQGTVTSGVISALHRGALAGEGIPDAIQTDAPINPGNSGGALADARGTVIGINSAIAGTTGGFVGVGFAIPIDIARKLADQIIATGRARLPFLGIEGANVPNGGGALIARVEPGSPADRAGLQNDDIIVGLDGERIGSMDELIEVLLTKEVGQEVTVVFVRDGRRRTARAVLAERPQA